MTREPPLVNMDSTILMFAFRYALGRQSMAPSIIKDVLKDNWEYLSDQHKKQIKEEISSAIDMGYAGSDLIDVPMWRSILAWR
jgi:hypothetical protein